MDWHHENHLYGAVAANKHKSSRHSEIQTLEQKLNDAEKVVAFNFGTSNRKPLTKPHQYIYLDCTHTCIYKHFSLQEILKMLGIHFIHEYIQ